MGKQDFEDSLLSGTNAPFVEAVYEDYLKNPALVSLAWRNFFESMHEADAETSKQSRPKPMSQSLPADHTANVEQVSVSINQPADTTERKQVAVLQLINAYRYLGINEATLDPIKREKRPDVPELDPAHYGFTEADMDTVFNTGTLVGPERSTLKEILQALKQTYCGTIGAEYMYITDVEQKRWIQSRLEGHWANPKYTAEQKYHILERLNAAEGLEKYLHTRYVGQKRFSGEGNESLIPLLDNLLQRAGQEGVEEIVIGMAH
ncbi:MAG: 2-oxoglutarate dehydrogenase E1 component, partial [Nitrosomonas sp.]|nr:2-oxoglutarate dehydrogenase E1 component [Nitrosomonas sp.]